MKKSLISLLMVVCIVAGTGLTSPAGSACTAYLQSGGSVARTGQSYCGTATDESPVKVTNSGIFTLSNSTIEGSGNTSSGDNSSFYGLNAGVLATSSSTIDLSNSTVKTTGTGGNGVFATGTGSSVTLSHVTINCTGQLGHGVDATLGGTLTLTDVDITTAGTNAAAIATDRGSGTITVTGGTMTTSGADSPGIYSTGIITVSDATITATGSESAVIEGENSITLTNTSLSGEKKWGVMIYQSMSGDAAGSKGTFNMTGGSLSAAVGPLFYVTNSTGVIALKGVSATAYSGTLVSAAAGNWGTSGSNGGTAILTADSQTLTGNLITDNISTITATLQNGTTLTGYINSAALNLDATSAWHVTANSYLTSLTDPVEIVGSTIGNIYGNGFTVFYDSSLAANSWLGGKTYSLNGGGSLTPGSESAADSQLAAVFAAQGILLYRNSAWTTLTSSEANYMAGYGNKLAANFSLNGLCEYDGTTWTQISSNSSVENLVGISGKLYVDYGNNGLWMYDGAWTQITPGNPNKMAANGANLLANFPGWGIYQYDGTSWTQLISDGGVENMLGASGKVYADFGVWGLWKYDAGSWTQLSATDSENMTASLSTLFIDFGVWGLWAYYSDKGTWEQISTSDAKNMAASTSTLFADFGALGLWAYNRDKGTWAQILASNPDNMVVSGSTLFADFGVWGLWAYNSGTAAWTQISTSDAEKMISVSFK